MKSLLCVHEITVSNPGRVGCLKCVGVIFRRSLGIMASDTAFVALCLSETEYMWVNPKYNEFDHLTICGLSSRLIVDIPLFQYVCQLITATHQHPEEKESEIMTLEKV